MFVQTDFLLVLWPPVLEWALQLVFGIAALWLPSKQHCIKWTFYFFCSNFSADMQKHAPVLLATQTKPCTWWILTNICFHKLKETAAGFFPELWNLVGACTHMWSSWTPFCFTRISFLLDAFWHHCIQPNPNLFHLCSLSSLLETLPPSSASSQVGRLWCISLWLKCHMKPNRRRHANPFFVESVALVELNCSHVSVD